MKLMLFAAKIALLVNEATIDPAVLTPSLRSADAVERATAARVAAVRGVDRVVPQLREALAAETNADSAREQVRALVILGSDDDVAFAAGQLPRFPSSIDSDFAVALGRLGAPRATDLHLRHASALRNARPAVAHALWGRSALITATASRALGAKDARAWRELLRAAIDSSLVLDAGIVASALTAQSDDILTDTLWYVIEMHAGDPASMPEAVRAAAVAERPGASIGEAFARTVLARMFGAEIVTRRDALAWLASPEGRAYVPETKTVLRFLTLDEQNALRDEALAKLKPAPIGVTFPVREPFFALPISLPRGLPERIFAETRCRDGWLGIVGATVDRAGRLQSVDVSKLATSSGCRRALETMLRLSFAEPSSMLAPFTANDLLVVKARGDASCLDENPVEENVVSGALRLGGSDAKAPVVTRRVEPVYPASVRRDPSSSGNLIVVLEAHITRTGCVRDIRILSQTPWPELNGSAVQALSQWKFAPGKLAGRPVDVIFNLTINFKR